MENRTPNQVGNCDSVCRPLCCRSSGGRPDEEDNGHRGIQREENDPELKYLIFTEFVPTQDMLRDFLEQHGFTAACLNRAMDLDERRRVQRRLAEKARILVGWIPKKSHAAIVSFCSED